jgi:hypothetical protein
MRIISPATERDVLAALRPPAATSQPRSGPWTIAFIEQATKQFDGRWSIVELSGSEALDIIVPAHQRRAVPRRSDGVGCLAAASRSNPRLAALAACRVAMPARIARAGAESSRPSTIRTGPSSSSRGIPLALDDYADRRGRVARCTISTDSTVWSAGRWRGG